MNPFSLKDCISIWCLLLILRRIKSLAMQDEPDGQHPGVMQSNGKAEQIGQRQSHRRKLLTGEQAHRCTFVEDARKQWERDMPDPGPQIDGFITMQHKYAPAYLSREKHIDDSQHDQHDAKNQWTRKRHDCQA